MKEVTLTCISDLHGHLPAGLPAADVLVIAGDICPDGSVDQQCSWLSRRFRPWLDSQPFTVTVATWGNHDWIGTRPERVPKDIHWNLLVDSGFSWGGLNFWGTPWQPAFCDWAFNATDAELWAKAALIPGETDVLVSHGPPRYWGDKVDGVSVGSIPLAAKLSREWIHLTVCGHIHEGYGVEPVGLSGYVVNASLLDGFYEPVNKPIQMKFVREHSLFGEKFWKVSQIL